VLNALNSIDDDLQQIPLVWFERPSQNVRTGTPATFTVTGNTSPSFVVARYEWDFDGDLTTDATTTTPSASHTFPVEGEYLTAVRLVSADGRSTLASASTTVDSDGDGLLGVDDSCPNVADPGGLDTDGDGVSDACDPTPGLPTPSIPRDKTDLVLTGTGATTGNVTTATYTVKNKGLFAGQEIELSIDVAGATNVTPSTCVPNTDRIVCTIGIIPPGGGHQIEVGFTATPAINLVATVKGTLASQRVDLVPEDNTVRTSLPPIVQCETPTASWSASNVSIRCAAADADGLADPASASFDLATTVPDGTETATASTGTRNVCDTTGSCRVAGPFTDLKIDRKAPVVTVTTPASGATYTQGTSVLASYSCVDIGSQLSINGCVGTVQNGLPIDTTTPGTRTFDVIAADTVGNSTTTKISYMIVPAAPTRSVIIDFDAGVKKVGFPTKAVAVWGRLTGFTVRPTSASVQWTTGGPWTPLIVSNATGFIAANVYPTNGTYVATTRICAESNACVTDTVTIVVGVPYPTPAVTCVVDQGPTMSPRYLARFGYVNTGTVPVVAPKPLVNVFPSSPFDRNQPQVLLPGTKTNVASAPFASGSSVTWSIYGTTATAKSTSPRC
jgi:PKD domain